MPPPNKRKYGILQPGLSQGLLQQRGIKAAFADSKDVNQFGRGFTSDEQKTCLSMKYGHSIVTGLITVLERIPDTVPVKTRRDVFRQQIAPQYDQEIGLVVFDHLEASVPHKRDDDPVLFAPPTGFCGQCKTKDNRERPLSTHNQVSNVKHISLHGCCIKKKVNLRCKSCNCNYNVTQYGKAGEFRLYPEKRNFIEVTDGVVADRAVLEQYCSLHLHCWTTFEGYAEQYNTMYNLDHNTGLNGKLVSNLYFKGEVENELRELRRVDFPFSMENLEPAYELVDEERRMSIYKHECTPTCIAKGCKELHVADGLWKLVFRVCSMRTVNIVNGFPLLKYPDQCTNEPTGSHCFCEEHIKVMQEEGIPTHPQEFLKYCKQQSGGKKQAAEGGSSKTQENITVGKVTTRPKQCGRRVGSTVVSTHGSKKQGVEEGTKKEEKEVVVPDSEIQNMIEETVTIKHRLRRVGTPVVSTHGANKMINDHVQSLPSVLDDCVKDPEITDEPCHKETGTSEGLHMRSRGYFFIVTAGGFIETFTPLYRSESPSQAFLIMLTFLYTLLKDRPSSEWDKVWLAYDNMCNITRMKAARQEKLPLPGELSKMWTKVNKMIDSFHIVNHKKDSRCQKDLDPKRFKDKNKHLEGMNSAAAEQCFNWLGRYKRQVLSIPKIKQMFMLHRLSRRRNRYVSKCHVQQQDPLPHVRVSGQAC